MKPILFSTPLVQAILEGRKTMTRRIIKPQPVLHNDVIKMPISLDKYAKELTSWQKKGYKRIGTDGAAAGYLMPECPWGNIGDIIWVRETWAPFLRGTDDNSYVELIKFKADGFELPVKHVKDYSEWHNRPGIHMNKEYCRLFLKIKSIRAERLQDVTEEDALKEGVEPRYCSQQGRGPDIVTYKNYLNDDPEEECIKAVRSFETLWRKINGHESWESNPWVWVIEFERCEKPE